MWRKLDRDHRATQGHVLPVSLECGPLTGRGMGVPERSVGIMNHAGKTDMSLSHFHSVVTSEAQCLRDLEAGVLTLLLFLLLTDLSYG